MPNLRCLWWSFSSALGAVLGVIVVLPIMSAVSHCTNWQIVVLYIQTSLNFLEPRSIFSSCLVAISTSVLGESVVAHIEILK
jgi:hypothetical protein